MARLKIGGCATLGLLLALWPIHSRAADHNTAVAVADFDYQDTSGEVADQAAAHATRVRAFGQLVRDELAAKPAYRIVRLNCDKPPCSATSLGADDLIAAARQAGARLLVYGGIHKMSTLVQWGDVQVVDLEQKKLLLNRMFTFRGDTDEAFRRAADFIGKDLAGVAPKP
jgi:Protein of unknown function (DUF2380)